MSKKYDAPGGPPPPAYGSEDTSSAVPPPQPAHIPPQNTGTTSNLYNATPQPLPQQPNQPYYNNGYPPQNGYYQQPQGGYYAPGPQMGYQQQGGMYPQQGGYGGGYGGYPPQQQYGGGYGYGQGPYGQRSQGDGFFEACLAGLACCCCLDACLLF